MRPDVRFGKLVTLLQGQVHERILLAAVSINGDNSPSVGTALFRQKAAVPEASRSNALCVTSIPNTNLVVTYNRTLATDLSLHIGFVGRRMPPCRHDPLLHQARCSPYEKGKLGLLFPLRPLATVLPVSGA